MTVDQRRSRRDIDRVEALLDDLAESPMLRPFERTAGDEVQAVSDSPSTVVDVALDLLERGHWSIGIGVGTVQQPLPAQTRAGRGPAFESARIAVERAKSAPVTLAVSGPPRAADAETVLILLGMLVVRRSDAGRAAVALMRAGHSQSEAADSLGISKQAVSQRLSTAGWRAEEAARDLAARLLGEADSA